MHPALPAPTGTARDDLLQLELSEQPPAGDPGRADAVTESVRPVPKEVPNEATDEHEQAPQDPLSDRGDRPGSAGEHLLQCAYGSQERADRFYSDQVTDSLNDAMIEFVQRMEMAFVATADADGEADCSLRAGPAGFIQVLDRERIAYPEYRGNGVLASLGNISENPHVGVLMVDFVTDLIGLHVNGRAKILEDVDLRADHPDLPAEADRGRTPERWVVVDIEEAYIHCRKHIPRMRPVERTRAWGTDDMKRKGGDYFGLRAARRQGVR